MQYGKLTTTKFILSRRFDNSRCHDEFYGLFLLTDNRASAMMRSQERKRHAENA